MPLKAKIHKCRRKQVLTNVFIIMVAKLFAYVLPNVKMIKYYRPKKNNQTGFSLLFLTLRSKWFQFNVFTSICVQCFVMIGDTILVSKMAFVSICPLWVVIHSPPSLLFGLCTLFRLQSFDLNISILKSPFFVFHQRGILITWIQKFYYHLDFFSFLLHCIPHFTFFASRCDKKIFNYECERERWQKIYQEKKLYSKQEQSYLFPKSM
jgi:hypothetical protein